MKNKTDLAFLLIYGILFIFGATGTYKNDAVILSIVNGILFIGIKLIQNVKIQIPKNFYLYSVFLLSLLIHSLFFDGKFDYLWIFLSGGLYWFHFYNMKAVVSRYFLYFLILSGIIMTSLFIYSNIHSVYFLSEANLFLPTSLLITHNHIGDLWAIILVAIVFLISQRVRWWHFLAITTGLVMIALSQSRSAIVALGVGVAYIFYTSADKKDLKKYLFAILTICLVLFIYFGIYKTTLFARPYFLEAVIGLQKFPAGTGTGNFSKISVASSLTHNIVLEIVSGMGVYSIVFIMWILKIFQLFIQKKSNTLYTALILAISTNFMFDTTYTIPTMIWLWFASLALIY